MRDRLIKLLREKEKLVNQMPQSTTALIRLADHLLSNGVIVPPVPLGSKQKIYYPVKGTDVIHETKVYGIGVDEDGDMIINPTEYPEKVIGMAGVVLGEHIFLIREQAEQALAERKHG